MVFSDFCILFSILCSADALDINDMLLTLSFYKTFYLYRLDCLHTFACIKLSSLSLRSFFFVFKVTQF